MQELLNAEYETKFKPMNHQSDKQYTSGVNTYIYIYIFIYSSLFFIIINITSSSFPSPPHSSNLPQIFLLFIIQSIYSVFFLSFFCIIIFFSLFSYCYYPSVSHSPTSRVFSLHKYLLQVLLRLNIHKIKIPSCCKMTRNNGLPAASEYYLLSQLTH